MKIINIKVVIILKVKSEDSIAVDFTLFVERYVSYFEETLAAISIGLADEVIEIFLAIVIEFSQINEMDEVTDFVVSLEGFEVIVRAFVVIL